LLPSPAQIIVSTCHSLGAEDTHTACRSLSTTKRYPPSFGLKFSPIYIYERSYTTSYIPFQPLPGVDSEVDVKNAYTNIVLVCRNWHKLAIRFLYRNLKIPDSESDVVWTRNHPEYGQWVQRAILSYSSTTMSDSQTRSSIAILALCPNIEVLIQPQHPPLSNPFLEFNALSPQLPSLKRLEWWNYGAGFNTLLSVLSAAPNLEYLFLGLPGFALVNSIPAHTPDIHLPSLRTLRLSILLTPASEYLTRAISKWSLPSLDTLVSDLPLGLNKVWTSHGSRLRVVELEEYDIPCLQGCPALRELNCSLPTSPLRGESTSYTSVTTIQYHAASKSLTPGYLEQHFLPLQLWFPNLECLRIYGPLAALLVDGQFPAIFQRLSNQGVYIVEIIDENGLVVSVYRPES
ncbi:hypothetical protein B0H16DRAFT_666348, partial [Mycena metata]